MERTKRLDKKVAIITGAASGIGRATSLRFAQEGARLVLADINSDDLQESGKLLEETGAEVVVRQTDVSVEKEIESLVNLALDSFSQIDILCNNAGITGDLSELEKQDASIWQKVLQTNLVGAVLGTKYVAAHMKQRRTGAIVNTASVAGIRSGAGGNAYSASKAAIINFTMTSACDLGSFNVRVNAVCPGLVETGMTKPIFDYARKSGKEEKIGKRCELRRYGHPVEIANAILFLASDEASFVTGQALAVDGGNTASLNLPGMKV